MDRIALAVLLGVACCCAGCGSVGHSDGAGATPAASVNRGPSSPFTTAANPALSNPELSTKPAYPSDLANAPAVEPTVHYAPPPPAGSRSSRKGDGDSSATENRNKKVKKEKKEYTGKPVSLDLQDADIKNVLRLLADVSGTNIVVEPDVAGKVTLKVERVPWDQMLDMVLQMNGLGKEQTGDVIRIAKSGKLDQEVKDQETKLKAQQQLTEVVQNMGEVSTVYFTLNYAKPDAFSGIISNMKSEKGKVVSDERTNMVIYSDYPYFINNAKQMLARIDKPKTQVLIETRFVRVNTNASFGLGVDWNWGPLVANGTQSTLPTGPTGNGNTLLRNMQINLPVTGTALMGFTLGQIAGNFVDVQISAMEAAGEGKVISAPRVLTLDGVEATISQGTEIPYLQLSQNGTAATAFQNVVLELVVKPNITPDGRIKMQLHAKDQTPDYSQLIGTEAQPAIDTREIKTELMIDDGNTIVIGGIIEDDNEKSVNGTPGISSIPLLGSLFKSQTTTVTKTELLIFITPRVIGVTIPDGVKSSNPVPRGPSASGTAG